MPNRSQMFSLILQVRRFRGPCELMGVSIPHLGEIGPLTHEFLTIGSKSGDPDHPHPTLSSSWRPPDSTAPTRTHPTGAIGLGSGGPSPRRAVRMSVGPEPSRLQPPPLPPPAAAVATLDSPARPSSISEY
jgi:hypothetical protein